MTIIYRIQDKDGRGPWKPGMSDRWVEYRDDHQLLHPWYIEFLDLKFEKGYRYGCGCETRKQLQRWITGSEYERLLIFGYRAVMIECEIVAISEIQCVFRKRDKFNVGATEFNIY